VVKLALCREAFETWYRPCVSAYTIFPKIDGAAPMYRFFLVKNDASVFSERGTRHAYTLACDACHIETFHERRSYNR